MELQNSYIFLKNPYKKEKIKQKNDNGKISLVIGKNVYSYINSTFNVTKKVDEQNKFYKKKLISNMKIGNSCCSVEFIITEVVDVTYLDVVVNGKTKLQVIKCLERVNTLLLASGIRENYIDIISYDAISEYYCNKIYTKFNTLERNLRKLLFNTYVVNFGKNYYKETIDEDLQNKIKKVINTDCSGEEKEKIKSDFNVSSRKETEEVERLQRFFYSFEYADIQNLLFTSKWTATDEEEKTQFLKNHENLSSLTNDELKEAFFKFSPKSDWERFFSEKIDIPDIKDIIGQIRIYRNSVAHFKFFYKEDYVKCNDLVNHLNSAIINAIRLTEEKDFMEKNAEAFSLAIGDIVGGLKKLSESITSTMQQVATTVLSPAFHLITEREDGISKIIEQATTPIPNVRNYISEDLIKSQRKINGILNKTKSSMMGFDGMLASSIVEKQNSISKIIENSKPIIPSVSNYFKNDLIESQKEINKMLETVKPTVIDNSSLLSETNIIIQDTIENSNSSDSLLELDEFNN